MSKTEKRASLAVLVAISVLHIVYWLSLDRVGFGDGDGYLRLVRVEELLSSGAWFDSTIRDANAPYGFEIHWTRLYDSVLAVIALPLIPFLGVERAVNLAGVWVSPLMHLGTAIAVMWAFRPLVGGIGSAVAAALTAAQTPLLANAIVGRSDHHMFMALLAVVAVGFLVRGVQDKRDGAAIGLGVVLGLGIWASPEFLLLTFFLVLITSLEWLVGRPKAVRFNIVLAFSLAISTALFVLVERGFDRVFTVSYDRISIFNVALPFWIGVFWLAVSWVGGQRQSGLAGRTTLALVGVTIVGALTFVVFPGVTNYPLAEYDPAFMPVQEQIKAYRSIDGTGDFLIFFGGALLSVFWIAYQLSSKSGEQRAMWLALGTICALYLVIGTFWLRWSVYANLFSVVALAEILVVLDRELGRRFRFPIRPVVKLIAILAVVIGPVALGKIFDHLFDGEDIAGLNPGEECQMDKLIAVLNADDFTTMPRTIVASANHGPQIIYETHHRVVATLHHPNAEGVLDGMRLLMSTDERSMIERIRLRKIDMVILCAAGAGESYFRNDAAPDALVSRLDRGNLPSWIQEYRPENADLGQFQIFLIDPELTSQP